MRRSNGLREQQKDAEIERLRSTLRDVQYGLLKQPEITREQIAEAIEGSLASPEPADEGCDVAPIRDWNNPNLGAEPEGSAVGGFGEILQLTLACMALASLVRVEFGHEYSLAKIAWTWGEGIPDDQIAALDALERGLLAKAGDALLEPDSTTTAEVPPAPEPTERT